MSDNIKNNHHDQQFNSALIDVAETERALRLILEPGQVTELRALSATNGRGSFQQTYSGYFDDPAKLAREAATTLSSATGIYFVPNRVNRALLSRAANRIRAVKKDPTTADTDIVDGAGC